MRPSMSTLTKASLIIRCSRCSLCLSDSSAFLRSVISRRIKKEQKDSPGNITESISAENLCPFFRIAVSSHPWTRRVRLLSSKRAAKSVHWTSIAFVKPKNGFYLRTQARIALISASEGPVFATKLTAPASRIAAASSIFWNMDNPMIFTPGIS
jgi:hypothetical protein